MKSVVSATLLVLGLLSFSGLAQAQEEVRVRPVDVYISGFGGYSFPSKTDFSFLGFTAPDVELKNSPSFGGKIGMWITAPRKTLGIDVGMEVDVTHFTPDEKMSNTFKLGATYFGVNVLARVPIGVTQDLPNGRWFPYIGVGGGGQRLDVKVTGFSDGRDTAPAFQGLGGVKVFVTKHLAVFAEGKYTHASHTMKFDLGSGFILPIDLTVSAVHGTGGLSLHF